MKKLISTLVITTIAMVSALPVMAQQKRLSPHETISAVIDGNRVTITYGRPYTKNPGPARSAKSGAGWCPTAKSGAWARTRPRCSSRKNRLMIGRQTIPAGAYTLWMLPQEDGTAKLAHQQANRAVGSRAGVI